MLNKLPAIIACDLDGTFFSDAQQTVMSRTYDVVSQCVKAGAAFIPVTGRSEFIIPFDRLPPLRYLVTCNGALVKDMQLGAILRAQYLPWQDVRLAWETARECLKGDDFLLELFEDDGITMEEKVRGRLSEYKGRIPAFHFPYLESGRARWAQSFERYIDQGCTHVSKVNFPGRGLALRAELTDRLKSTGRFTVVSDGMNIEVMARGCNKGEALLWLANSMNVPNGDIIAFGDSSNDLSMLYSVGWGVAMGNATASIRENVPYCTAPHNADGIAAFLQDNFSALQTKEI